MTEASMTKKVLGRIRERLCAFMRFHSLPTWLRVLMQVVDTLMELTQEYAGFIDATVGSNSLE